MTNQSTEVWNSGNWKEYSDSDAITIWFPPYICIKDLCQDLCELSKSSSIQVNLFLFS